MDEKESHFQGLRLKVTVTAAKATKTQELILRRDFRDFETESLEMRSFFLQHGYPSYLLDTAIQKPFNVSCSDTLKPPSEQISTENVPLNKIRHYQQVLFLAVELAVIHVLFLVKPPSFLDLNLILKSSIISHVPRIASFTAYPAANAINSKSVRLANVSLTDLPNIFVP